MALTLTPRAFTGFTPETFSFFRRLARNNRKAWFDENRATYDDHVVAPLKSLFEALAPAVLSLHPDFEVSGRTGKNFSRINRDIRFARDKSPYRSNLYLYFSERGSAAHEARLYVGVSADGATCGFAIYHRPRGIMERLLKPRRARNPDAVHGFIRKISRRYETYWHGTERGEWTKYAGPPRADEDWKRVKAWIVRKLLPPSSAELRSPRFLKTATRVFRELYPLYALSAAEGPEGERPLTR